MPLICFASPSGGVGRTTLAANVARELGRAGARVIAVDLDPQNALGMHFGLDLRDAFGFLATLRYAADPRAAWRAALRSSPSGVSFLPFGQSGMDGANAADAALMERPEMLAAAMADMLSVSGVTVVADLPAGPSPALAAVIAHADLLVAPVLPNPASVAQMPAVEGGRFAGIGSAGGFDAARLLFVINQWGAPGRLASAIAQGAAQQLTGRLLGAVRYDEAVPEACAAQRLLGDFAPGSVAAQDMAGLTAAIVAQVNAAGSPAPAPALRRGAAPRAIAAQANTTTTTTTQATAAESRSAQLRNASPLITLAEMLPRSRSTNVQKADR